MNRESESIEIRVTSSAVRKAIPFILGVAVILSAYFRVLLDPVGLPMPFAGSPESAKRIALLMLPGALVLLALVVGQVASMLDRRPRLIISDSQVRQARPFRRPISFSRLEIVKLHPLKPNLFMSDVLSSRSRFSIELSSGERVQVAWEDASISISEIRRLLRSSPI